MNDPDPEATPPASEEGDYLRRSLRRIIISQEIGPRAPHWRAAWKRTLFRYARQLRESSIRPPTGDSSR